MPTLNDTHELCPLHRPLTDTRAELRCDKGDDLDILRNDGLIMDEMRLGDVIDDHCIKCRRVTNHAIVSLVDGEAAKVRCRTCYHDHDYRHEQAPPSKKELKKAEAEAQAAAAAASDGASGSVHLDAEKAASGS